MTCTVYKQLLLMQYLQIKESQPNSQLMRMTSVHHRLRGTCEQCVDVHMSLCVCIDCSQLLNINLKVKGMELFDIHAGCCTLCLVLKPNPRCCLSYWLTGSLWLPLFLPFFLQCCVCTQMHMICFNLKVLHVQWNIISMFKISGSLIQVQPLLLRESSRDYSLLHDKNKTIWDFLTVLTECKDQQITQYSSFWRDKKYDVRLSHWELWNIARIVRLSVAVLCRVHVFVLSIPSTTTALWQTADWQLHSVVYERLRGITFNPSSNMLIGNVWMKCYIFHFHITYFNDWICILDQYATQWGY